jgi:hypothetical protein
MSKRIWKLMAALSLGIAVSAAAANKVGNGDDGTDLEDMQPLTSGPLAESRDRAVALLKRLDVGAVRGLGDLIPEVQHAELYLDKQDMTANQPVDEGTFHTNLNGFVYARTFPMPHAATRFFPVANGLDRGQMVALHIHEALHRALPANIREDEPVVTALTLAITSPDATNDRVRETAARYVSDSSLAGEEEHFKQPSSIGYGYREFWRPNPPSNFRIARMHVLQSDLYPFGGANTPFGFGIRASFIQGPGGNQTGPLGLSAKLRLWSRRDFSVGIFGEASLNALSAEELKNSPFGRDVFTLGLSLRKDLRRFYIENYVSFDTAGKSKQTVGLITYQYGYGGVVDAKIRGGYRLGAFELGAFTELHLASSFKVSGGAFEEDFGRYRILSAGPEISYTTEDYALGVQGRFLLDSTKNANFDFLGNLMGPGVSQGSIGISGKVFF